MIGNERRLSQEEFKQCAGELIKMFGRDGFDDLPLWMQVTVLAALKTGNEDDCSAAVPLMTWGLLRK
jgi:hypothetical protein